MKIEVVTFINTHKNQAGLYKKCIDTQREWAELHGMGYHVFEYTESGKVNDEWEFYCNYFNMTKEEGTHYLGILPSVMILNTHKNPFKDIHWDGILINSLSHPSFFLSTRITDVNLVETVNHSKLFKNTPSSFPMLGLRVIFSKTVDYVVEYKDLHVGIPYIQGLSSGMEMHLDTNKDGIIEVSYSPRLLDDEQFYQPGDFAVNIPFKNGFKKAYIKEYSLVKKQIDKIMKIGKSLENDL